MRETIGEVNCYPKEKIEHMKKIYFGTNKNHYRR